MKFAKFFAVLAVVGLVTLSSCKKDDCYECVQDGADTVSLCRDEYPTTLGIDNLSIAVESFEQSGYTCTKK